MIKKTISLRLVLLLSVLACRLFATNTLAAPGNDNFASATVISGATGTKEGSREDATLQAGEPVHAGVGGPSVWYRWTAPISGAVTFDTADSSFDTVLAVYTGSSLNGLTLIAQNDNDPAASEPTSRVSFPITAGTVYRIAIAGTPDEDNTDFVLNWTASAGGLFRFIRPAFPVREFDGSVLITVERVGNALSAQTVAYSTIDDTATEEEDYTAVSGTLSFAAGVTQRTFSVPILDDTDLEGDETFFVHLENASGGALVGADATVIIDDNEDDPENDNFANATLLVGASDSGEFSNEGAHLEAGEPTHGGPGGHSIWFRWKAPATGIVSFSTEESTDLDGEPLDTVMAAYTGSSLGTLKKIVENDNAPGFVTSRISFAVTAGVTYSIAVDGRAGAQGDISLSWEFGVGGALQFSNPTYSINEAGATSITITVVRVGGATGAVTLDYSADAGTATAGEDFTAVSGTLSFAAGQTVRTFSIPLFDDAKAEGDETILLTLSSPDGGAVLGARSTAVVTIEDDDDDPANDNFANAEVIPSAAGSVAGNNAGATRQSGEPAHAGKTGHRSIWYRWTSPITGVAIFDTNGSILIGSVPLDTTLAVYTGNALAQLTPIVSNDDAAAGVVTSRAGFAVQTGVTYSIAVDAKGDLGGSIALNWSFGSGGQFEFAQSSYTVRENAGVLNITVRRKGGTTDAVTVDYAAEESPSGTAAGGDDFTEVTGTLSFPVGATTATFDVPILNDDTVEGDEAFQVTLSNPTNGAILSDVTISAPVVIDDDDDDPANDLFANAQVLTGLSGSIEGDNSGAGVEAGEPGTENGSRTIWYRWTAPATGSVTFDTIGSGLTGAPLDTILRVSTGSPLTALQLVATNDNISVNDVSSRVQFSTTAGTVYQISIDARAPIAGPTQLNWSLISSGNMAFDQEKYRVKENDPSGVLVTVRRSGQISKQASVAYETIDGAAKAGTDYQATSGVLHFAPAQATKSFRVKPINNAAIDGERTLQVRLTNPSTGGALGFPSTAEVRIFDDEGAPANNSFASASVILKSYGKATATNVGASVEAGESLPGIVSALGGGRTVWFKWKAPSDGVATFSTDGSVDADGEPLDTVLGIYSGNSMASLKLVAENDESEDGQTSEVSFAAVAARTYYIVLDTVGDKFGLIKLSWDVEEPDNGSLLQASATAPSLTFTERYKDKLIGNVNDGYDYKATGGFSFKIVTPLGMVDPAGITGDTEFSVELGDFYFDGKLRDDPKYKMGNTGASFTLYRSNDNGDDVKTGNVKLAWSKGMLTITGSASSPDDYDIITPGHTGETDPWEDQVDATVEFAGTSGSRIVYVKGTASVATKKDTDLSTVSANGAADFVPPTIVIQTPAAGASFNVDAAAISGTASDAHPLDDLEVRVNGGEFLDGLVVTSTNAEGTSANWSLASVPLIPGANLIEVFVTDESGNQAIAQRTVICSGTGLLTVEIEGQGSVSPNLTSTAVALGSRQTLTAAPASGWVFAEWSGDISASTAAIDFTMSEGLVLHARFVPELFSKRAGSYLGAVRSGLFDFRQTGALTLKLDAKGSFTGKLGLGGASFGFKSVFNVDGNATFAIPRKAGGPLNVQLHLDAATGQITGSVGDQTFSSELQMDRTPYDGKTTFSPYAGSYTAILPSITPLRGAGFSAGHGFASVVVAGNGMVRLAGSLADNSKISASSLIAADGVLLISQKVGKAGLLSGSALFGTSVNEQVTGIVHWYRPAGAVPALDLDLGFAAEKYAEPNAGTRVLPTLASPGMITAALAGAGYTTERVQTITIGADNSVTISGAGLSALKITTKNGLFTGAIADPAEPSKKLTLKGAFLQGSGIGAGYFTNKQGGSGYFTIGVP